jgi:hypothetical protein
MFIHDKNATHILNHNVKWIFLSLTQNVCCDGKDLPEQNSFGFLGESGSNSKVSYLLCFIPSGLQHMGIILHYTYIVFTFILSRVYGCLTNNNGSWIGWLGILKASFTIIITINYENSQSIFSRTLLLWLPRTRSILVFFLRYSTTQNQSQSQS